MQYEVEIGGRRRQVAVSRVGDRFAVTVDGATKQVDVARIDARGDYVPLPVWRVQPDELRRRARFIED